MAEPREIHRYDYVNHPYERVRDALRADAAAVFRAATSSASARAGDVAAALRVNIAGLEIGKEIVIVVGKVEEKRSPAHKTMVLRQELTWQAAKAPRLFPLMRAELSVYALTATETQLDRLGHYRPPLGVLGKAIDKIVGHRIAEASVHQFLGDIAAHLRRTIR